MEQLRGGERSKHAYIAVVRWLIGWLGLFLGDLFVFSLLSSAPLDLATRQHEVIVIALASPWTMGHITDFDKLPIDGVGLRKTEIITYRRGYT